MHRKKKSCLRFLIDTEKTISDDDSTDTFLILKSMFCFISLPLKAYLSPLPTQLPKNLLVSNSLERRTPSAIFSAPSNHTKEVDERTSQVSLPKTSAFLAPSVMLQQLPASTRHEILLGGCEAIPAASCLSNRNAAAAHARVRTSSSYGSWWKTSVPSYFHVCSINPFCSFPIIFLSGFKEHLHKESYCQRPIPEKWWCACPAPGSSAPLHSAAWAPPRFRPPCQYHILTSVRKPATPEGYVFKVFHTRRTAHR